MFSNDLFLFLICFISLMLVFFVSNSFWLYGGICGEQWRAVVYKHFSNSNEASEINSKPFWNNVDLTW
jgi:hypothetical protein